jgi:hypothetical protein
MIAHARVHPRSMHSPPIPSNLDVTESSTPIGRSRIERGDGGDYALYRDQLATRRGCALPVIITKSLYRSAANPLDSLRSPAHANGAVTIWADHAPTQQASQQW